MFELGDIERLKISEKVVFVEMNHSSFSSWEECGIDFFLI
jgi:hypothetical protein